MGVTHRLRLSIACVLAGAVLIVLVFCDASFAQDPTPTPTPSGPVQVDPNQLVDPEAAATPAATPEPTPTPTPRRSASPPAPGGGRATPTPSPTPTKTASRCPRGLRTSAMLAIGGSVGGEPGSSPTGLALVIAGGALALFATAFAVRRGGARRRQEDAPAKSPLEIGSLVVAICGGVTALLSTFAPGLVSHDRPPPQASMVVRDVNSRITLGEFASALKARQPPARQRLELGNVVWLKLRLEGYAGRTLALQWGSYEDGDGAALLPGTAHQTDLKVAGDTDVQDVVQPVWVRYPKASRFRVLFRLLDDARVQEMTRTRRWSPKSATPVRAARSQRAAPSAAGSVWTMMSTSCGQRSRTASSMSPARWCAEPSGCSAGRAIVTSAIRPALGVAERHALGRRAGVAPHHVVDHGALLGHLAAGRPHGPVGGGQRLDVRVDPLQLGHRGLDRGLELADDTVRVLEVELAGQLGVQGELVAAGRVDDADVVDLAHVGHGQRRGRRALAQAALGRARLDVDDHVGVAERVADRRLDVVGGAVGLADAGVGGHARSPGRRSSARPRSARARGAAPRPGRRAPRGRPPRPRTRRGPSARRSTGARAGPRRSTTSTATNRAAAASARGSPAATSARPIRTAIEPARSEAKCSALEASAAECSRRAARRLPIARLASIATTTTSTAIAHHVGLDVARRR